MTSRRPPGWPTRTAGRPSARVVRGRWLGPGGPPVCCPATTTSTRLRGRPAPACATPDLYEAARTNLAYGSRLRRARRRVDARAPLEHAYQAFQRLGARPWAAAAADELAATGVTVAPHGATGLDLLTPRERQIVQLLADGRTTRETAGALFLSPKTVEYHLRHVYTKLGITNRRELADLVASGG